MALRTGACAALAALAIAGCGSSGGSSSKTSTTPAEAGAPTALLGTYTTTLKRSDLPAKPAPELTHGSTSWNLTIANHSGSAGNVRAFTIANASLGPLESSPFGVRGDRIYVHHENCAAGGNAHFYENVYAYKLAGDKLTFTTVKNLCPDKVAETILTGEPWTRGR